MWLERSIRVDVWGWRWGHDVRDTAKSQITQELGGEAKELGLYLPAVRNLSRVLEGSGMAWFTFQITLAPPWRKRCGEWR